MLEEEFNVQRSFVLVLILVLMASSWVSASSWDWWGPSASDLPKPSGTTPLWPWFEFQPSPPKPSPQPVPSDPGSPLRPVQPSKPETSVPLPTPTISSEEQTLINQVNQERLQSGLKALQVDLNLVALAKEKSHDMAVHGYFSHVSPNLGTVYNMLDRAGLSYALAGENIARTGSFARIHPLFMGSSGHRANIMYSGYTHLGVGIIKYGTNYYVTQIFVKR